MWSEKQGPPGNCGQAYRRCRAEPADTRPGLCRFSTGCCYNCEVARKPKRFCTECASVQNRLGFLAGMASRGVPEVFPSCSAYSGLLILVECAELRAGSRITLLDIGCLESCQSPVFHHLGQHCLLALLASCSIAVAQCARLVTALPQCSLHLVPPSQIAEAAYSNKGVAVSPCEACGVAASADMAHILSVSLGHSLEGSELRIGHAAVALLNARLNGAAGGLASFGCGAGPEGAPSSLLMLTAPQALRALDLPSSSDGSWPAGLSRNSSPASCLDALERTTPPPAAPSAPAPLFSAPAPRFNGSAEQHSLLPPLPAFNSTIASQQAGRVSPFEGASGLPLGPPPAWHQDLSTAMGTAMASDHSLYGCASKFDLLDMIKDTSAWEAVVPRAAAASPSLLHDEASYHSLPASIPGMTAYPMPHGGMSVLLTSKARAGEAALAAGQTLGETVEGTAGGEGAPKESGKRAAGLLEDLFGAEGPAPERQLSADELAIQSYLEDDHAALCTAAAGEGRGREQGSAAGLFPSQASVVGPFPAVKLEVLATILVELLHPCTACFTPSSHAPVRC